MSFRRGPRESFASTSTITGKIRSLAIPQNSAIKSVSSVHLNRGLLREGVYVQSDICQSAYTKNRGPAPFFMLTSEVQKKHVFDRNRID